MTVTQPKGKDHLSTQCAQIPSVCNHFPPGLHFPWQSRAECVPHELVGSHLGPGADLLAGEEIMTVSKGSLTSHRMDSIVLRVRAGLQEKKSLDSLSKDLAIQ